MRLAQQTQQQQVHNPYIEDVHGNTQALMNEVVHISGLLRDFSATGLNKFNTPNATAYTPTGEKQQYNSGCFLRSDAKNDKTGKFNVMPISGKGTPTRAKGLPEASQNNHDVLASLWSDFVSYLEELHASTVSVYTAFYGVKDKDMLTSKHYEHLNKSLEDIYKSLDKEMQSFFSEMERWLRSIPTAEGFGNYYLFGFGKPYVEECVKEILYRVSRILYAARPFIDSAKDTEKLNRSTNTNVANTNT